MTQRTYDNIQGLLSYAVLLSGFIAFAFTLEYHNLLNAMDLSEFGKTYLPPFINTAWAIFALAVIAKLWGGWVHNKFWLKMEIADWFYKMSVRIDPRRR